MKDKTFSKILIILIPVAAVLIFLFKDYILALVPYFPACALYKAFHVYCPACGNTRSVTALLHGDLLGSLRYNIAPLFLILLMFLGYLELIAYSFGKHIRLLPRKPSFYLILISLFVIYWILRNCIPYLTP